MFEFVGTMDGSDPIIKEYVVANDEVLSIGEMVNLESGEADAGASGDLAFIGACVNAVNNADDGENVFVYANPNAIYKVTDLNARLAGANLDLASGGLGLTTDSNSDFVVLENSTATEKTLVMFAGTHYLNIK